MKKWMRKLAEQHQQMRQQYPSDELIVVFDIDDTILDLRYMISHVLHAFDQRHGTSYFQDLAICDIRVSEFGVRCVIDEAPIPSDQKHRILEWFRDNSWSSHVIRDGHQPYPGVLEVIRWIQTQPGTHVGLNTGRPESMRRDTLQCLHDVGRPQGVVFADNLLFMNPYGWGQRIVESKVEGLKHFQHSGYRIATFVDNEPENLQAVSDFDETGDILLLHADTIFSSERKIIPGHAVSGNIYDVTELAGIKVTGTEYYRAA